MQVSGMTIPDICDSFKNREVYQIPSSDLGKADRLTINKYILKNERIIACCSQNSNPWEARAEMDRTNNSSRKAQETANRGTT